MIGIYQAEAFWLVINRRRENWELRMERGSQADDRGETEVLTWKLGCTGSQDRTPKVTLGPEPPPLGVGRELNHVKEWLMEFAAA